jgi:membrane associated rhomboid family serine protease
MHLAFNLLTLFFFSFVLERKLGSGALALIYGLGLLISQGATALRYLRDSGYEGSVGASGAISALVLSAILLQPHLHFGLPWLSERFPFLQLPAPVVGGVYLLYSFVSIFLPPRLQFQVNHMAHFSGALAGLLLTLLLRPGAWIGLQHYILASL